MSGQDYPKRKILRLAEFDYSGNRAYFVTICVQNRACLLGDITAGTRPAVQLSPPGQMVTEWFQALEQRFPGATIVEKMVMPNHVHVVLLYDGRDAGTDLPRLIQWYKTQTSNAYIRGVKAGLYRPFPGRLWQRGYFEHVIRNERDLLEIRAYIQENPVRWAMKHGRVDG